MKIAKRDTYGVETIDGIEVRRQVFAGDPIPPSIEVDPDDVTERQGPVPQGPLAQVGGGAIVGDYDDHPVEELQGEVDRRITAGREIEVEGSGKDGNVVKADLVEALEADDDAA